MHFLATGVHGSGKELAQQEQGSSSPQDVERLQRWAPRMRVQVTDIMSFVTLAFRLSCWAEQALMVPALKLVAFI